ncbi:sensor histidine kinase [Desulfoferula mesophila]|uniref:Oxygen sensor histidine kinase NreB n=1 Tax=Desulfoferula mesophila TaxID=3058419 RepID=A0AAU9EGM4_9BACT|nr:hypothetical protein FAK_30110 [Desulfoferula mesophilus]
MDPQAKIIRLEKELARLRLRLDEPPRASAGFTPPAALPQEGELLFQTMFQVAAVGMTLTSLDHRPMEINPAMQRMLGYSAEELKTMTIPDFTHPDDIQREQAIVAALMNSEDHQQVHYEKRYIRKDGGMVWAELALSIVRNADGSPKYNLVMVEDITARKEAEEKVKNYEEQLRSLATELSLAEEREKRKAASYLHDRVAQNLSLAVMKLELLGQVPGQAPLAESLDQVKKMIQEVIAETRATILDLSPPVLQDLGLSAALEWLADRMCDLYGLEVVLKESDLEENLTHDLGGFVIRSVQELLYNVAKHAETPKAWVSIARFSNQLRLVVSDHGRGFDYRPNDTQTESGGGFGLFSLKERLRHLGGRLQVHSQVGNGTQVALIIPLDIRISAKRNME